MPKSAAKKRKTPLPVVAESPLPSQLPGAAQEAAAARAEVDVFDDNGPRGPDLAADPRHRARLVSAVRRLNALVTKCLTAVLPRAPPGGTGEERRRSGDERPVFGGGDAEFSEFLDVGSGAARAGMAAAAAVEGEAPGMPQGDVVCLEVEGSTLWSRLSFLNEATLHSLRAAAGEAAASSSLPLSEGDGAGAPTPEELGSPREASDDPAAAVFKDKFVDTFTAAFASDLEMLQNDKFLQELGTSAASGGVGLELLALALETGHSTYSQQQRDLFLESLREVGEEDHK